MGMSQLDPSVRGLLKNLGYATGQFGKNHVGDRNETLPTVNGFDEFFGNLYPLSAEEEPELPDYPKDPAFKEFPPRSTPPSFNPANMMEETLRDMKAMQKLERAFPMIQGELSK
jgi:arylsulfatase A-like enzyme